MNINLLNDTELNKLKTIINEAQKIVICAHKSPDGDAIGSSIAWKLYLKQIGKNNITICLPDAYPDFLQWLPETQEMLRYDKKPQEVQKAFDEADLICCLDFNKTHRVEEMEDTLKNSTAKKTINRSSFRSRL